MPILNITVVSIVSSIAFGGQTLTASNIAGLVLAVAAMWLLDR